MLTRATTLYGRARDLYLQAGARRPARACLTAMQDIYLIVGTYSATRSQMLEELETWYPDVPADQRAAWLDLPSTESLRWDGVKHYFYDVPVNLAYRDVDLFQTLPGHVAAYQRIYDELVPYLAVGAATPAWQQYGEPHAYDFTQTLSVPRAELAATGDLRAWLPVPIVVGPQSDVRIGEITPTTWLEYPPSITQDIGLLYLHVPLGELGGDLDLTLRRPLHPRRPVLQGAPGGDRRLRHERRLLPPLHGVTRQHDYHAVDAPDRSSAWSAARRTPTTRRGASTATSSPR